MADDSAFRGAGVPDARDVRNPRILLALALILVLTSLVYSSSFQNALLNWDDSVNVTQNNAIRALTVSNVREWFTQPLLGMYSPLVYASYAVDYRVGGLNPLVYHATNLVLHLACVLLVYGIVARLTSSPLGAVLAAAFFAVHPANVAAVTPISVRSSLLYSVFYLGAYRAYLWHLDRPGAARLAAVFFLFVGSSLSKSAAAVFPVLLVLTDYYRGRRSAGSALLEKLPFFAVAVAVGAVALAMRTDIASANSLQTSWLERAALAAYQLGHYLFTAVAPIGLSPFHPYPERTNGSLGWIVWVAPLFLIALALFIVRARALRAPLVFGLLFFGLHLALILKVVPLGEEFMADRYLYLPLVGLCVTAVALSSRRPPQARRAIAIGGCILVAAFALISYSRNADWRDDMAFNSRIIERYPRTAATAYANRAAARLQTGDIGGARSDSTAAISIDASNARAYFNRATAGMLEGKPNEALTDANRSIALDPALSASYELRAQARLRTGDITGARDDADRAIALATSGRPGHSTNDELFKSYVTRGLARAMLDDGAGALADLDRAIALNPAEPALLQNRGQVRLMFGDVKGGCADLKEAVARGREETRALLAPCNGR
jgi:protein O-mannosyl-transferase